MDSYWVPRHTWGPISSPGSCWLWVVTVWLEGHLCLWSWGNRLYLSSPRTKWKHHVAVSTLNSPYISLNLQRGESLGSRRWFLNTCQDSPWGLWVEDSVDLTESHWVLCRLCLCPQPWTQESAAGHSPLVSLLTEVQLWRQAEECSVVRCSGWGVFNFTWVHLKILWALLSDSWSLSWWCSGKESTCNAGDAGSIPRSGRSPGVRNDNPLQYYCLENFMDREAWWAWGWAILIWQLGGVLSAKENKVFRRRNGQKK